FVAMPPRRRTSCKRMMFGAARPLFRAPWISEVRIMRFSPFALVLLGAPCAPLAMSFPAQAAASAGQAADLAQAVEGRWRGDVTSDIRGSSRGGVTITVERVARNRVRISCDYARI